MKYYSDTDLDHALCALPLEEAPPDLRASILGATIYRPAPPFALWEAWTFGALAAVVAWLCVSIATGGADRAVAALGSLGFVAYHYLTQPSAAIWLAIGAGIAFWGSFANLAPAPATFRIRR